MMVTDGRSEKEKQDEGMMVLAEAQQKMVDYALTLELLGDEAIERLAAREQASAVRHDLEPEADLEHCDCCGPHRGPRLLVEPAQDRGIRRIVHKGGDDIGVEDDHSSNGLLTV